MTDSHIAVFIWLELLDIFIIIKMFGVTILGVLIGAGAVLAEDYPELRFYHGSFENFTDLPLERAADIMTTSWYNNNRTTVIYTFGYSGSPTGSAVKSILSTFIELGDSNVALLNWEYLAAQLNSLPSGYFNWAVPNGRKLGVLFADIIENLIEAGLDLKKIHFVGHSLGAHVLGITGNTLADRGLRIPRLTGLDPSYFGFESRSSKRLKRESAEYVMVIHTDPSKFGYRRSLGTVDFWPNYRNVGPVLQPGCGDKQYAMFSKGDLCNHDRCWKLLIDAMKHPGTVLGRLAKNYRDWKNQRHDDPITLDIADYHPNITPGNYYFVTNSESPFGLGHNGLYL